MRYESDNVDICVIGAGHAGCEAALASARMGKKTILFSINLDSVAMMPCNPNIGGSSKGHLVKEIDALGGEMGRNIDKTYIQSRMLNTGKGPAVYSLRVQADKQAYSQEMKKTIENTPNLTLVQDEIVHMEVENGAVKALIGQGGAVYNCQAVVICTGTYLDSRCLYGDVINESGPNGLKSSVDFKHCLEDLGIKMYRFKTGTPARVDRRTVDFSKMAVQEGDSRIVPFSFENENIDISREQIPCYLTYTNEATHEIIKANIHRSPMYSGVIEGTGTRYCPSIEDKIVRFADKDRHQVFVEPEGENTNEMYVQGMSTSLPEDVQKAMYRTLPGLENCRFTRTGYAIEYDCIDATQLKLSLEFKNVAGLFSAGQFNGSSGYEEAAAQGIIAGINAARFVDNETPFVIDRAQGYIGVLIDDLVTKGTKEPYRMMTSRAEYRLLLRQDNADLRLTEFGRELGLISDKRYQAFTKKRENIEAEIKRVNNIIIAPSDSANLIMEKYDSAIITTGIKLAELIRRPELNYEILAELDEQRPELTFAEQEQVNIQIKYEGYIAKQFMQVEKFRKMEENIIPENLDYMSIQGLRIEAKQKLSEIRPSNLGHAGRISGVSPADISVLMVYLEYLKKS